MLVGNQFRDGDCERDLNGTSQTAEHIASYQCVDVLSRCSQDSTQEGEKVADNEEPEHPVSRRECISGPKIYSPSSSKYVGQSPNNQKALQTWVINRFQMPLLKIEDLPTAKPKVYASQTQVMLSDGPILSLITVKELEGCTQLA